MDFLTPQTFTTLILVSMSLYCFYLAFMMNARNNLSIFLFNVLPFSLGLAGLVAAALNQGWIANVGG